MDGNVIILTLVPLLTPIATACGIDTIQLAIIVFVSIGIGSITPPMATCLNGMLPEFVMFRFIRAYFNLILPFLPFWCITYFAAGIVCSCRINLVAGLVLSFLVNAIITNGLLLCVFLAEALNYQGVVKCLLSYW